MVYPKQHRSRSEPALLPPGVAAAGFRPIAPVVPARRLYGQKQTTHFHSDGCCPSRHAGGLPSSAAPRPAAGDPGSSGRPRRPAELSAARWRRHAARRRRRTSRPALIAELRLRRKAKDARAAPLEAKRPKRPDCPARLRALLLLRRGALMPAPLSRLPFARALLFLWREPALKRLRARPPISLCASLPAPTSPSCRGRLRPSR